MGKIFILSGAVHTGKTTRLMQWSMTQKNIDGIFQPVVNEKRFIFHISSKTLKLLETVDSDNITEIGSYKFSKETFAWTQEILLKTFQSNCNCLIIDEIGPLELKMQGLEPAITEILSKVENSKMNVLLVVRDSILDVFIERYNLQNKYKIFNLLVSNI